MDEIMNLTYVPGKESFDMFKARFLNICVELKAMGEPLSTRLQRYILLRAMPPQYEGLVQSLKVNDGLSFDQVCIHIKEYSESSSRNSTSNGEKGVAYSMRHKEAKIDK